jgi:imidazolonepropionase-like amidohydrolase
VQVLRSATSINAALIQREGVLGVIRAGAAADLIVVDGDPLQDLSVLTDQTNIKLIMKDGRIFKNEIAGVANG